MDNKVNDVIHKLGVLQQMRGMGSKNTKLQIALLHECKKVIDKAIEELEQEGDGQ